VLHKEGPIDIYWDNVGGETLEAALEEANDNARFIECGFISQYNTASDKKSSVQGIRVRPLLTTCVDFDASTLNMQNLHYIFAKSIHMHGFIVSINPVHFHVFEVTLYTGWSSRGEV
jgi:NADPH-dependent curcumin reductase CurA